MALGDLQEWPTAPLADIAYLQESWLGVTFLEGELQSRLGELERRLATQTQTEVDLRMLCSCLLARQGQLEIETEALKAANAQLVAEVAALKARYKKPYSPLLESSQLLSVATKEDRVAWARELLAHVRKRTFAELRAQVKEGTKRGVSSTHASQLLNALAKEFKEDRASAGAAASTPESPAGAASRLLSNP